MKITEILTPEMVIPQMRGGSKAEVLSELAQCLCQAHPEVVFDRLLGVLNERERLGSTAIGDGIAIPHGKLPALKRLYGVFARLETPINFEAIDEQPVDLIFLLLAPEQAGADHLKALARISRLLREVQAIEKLRSSKDASALYAVLTEAATSHAA